MKGSYHFIFTASNKSQKQIAEAQVEQDDDNGGESKATDIILLEETKKAKAHNTKSLFGKRNSFHLTFTLAFLCRIF